MLIGGEREPMYIARNVEFAGEADRTKPAATLFLKSVQVDEVLPFRWFRLFEVWIGSDRK
jgi:hypothetical protein